MAIIDQLHDAIDNAGDSDECIPFYCSGANGYPRVRVGDRMIRANRISCQRAHGSPTKEKPNALHSCHNRKCINPNHLRWGSQSENIQEMYDTRPEIAKLKREHMSRLGKSNKKVESK